VFAIDPHRRPENNEEFLRNIKDARIEHVVNQMRTFSHEAVKAFEPGTVDVLFLDGAHDYASVFQDIKNWSPMLADGGVIAFNDAVWWSGVQRAILDTIARGRSPFRNPRWVFNTLFLDHVPSARWGAADAVRLARLKLFLRLGGRWARFHKKVESRTWDLAKRLDARLMALTLRAVLPAA